MKKPINIVFSDIDGCLLDHHNYQDKAAQAALTWLQKGHFPLVLVSSKTLSEMTELQRKWQLDTPMIIENGSAIAFPKSHYSEKQIEQAYSHGNYWLRALTEKIDTVALLENFQHCAKTFSQMDIEQLMALTDLEAEQARQAQDRLFSDPIYWSGSPQQLAQFKQHCHQLGIKVNQGGRFIHLDNGADKGYAVNKLIELLTQIQPQLNPICSLALGDGENDLPMLKVCDFAAQIASPSHHFPSFSHPNLFRSQQYGPAGWFEAIEYFFSRRQLA
ncbi:mannosyl-3-phosphoglycerate phosphatase [Paraferrimonas sp. SM1919]|uniref:HAD-IIB family hydrolase n=1 Tax=Paraferrimonas sp. SM1919 TaxID=2662263 RepID=UPI0013D00507|nr:HAD-IIB family hydrolase [Paraferrimonas sp. SM1919]